MLLDCCLRNVYKDYRQLELACDTQEEVDSWKHPSYELEFTQSASVYVNASTDHLSVILAY